MRTLYYIALATIAVIGCRPASLDNYLYNASPDQIAVRVTDNSNIVTLGVPEPHIAKSLKKIEIAAEQKGSFKPEGPKYVSLHSNNDQIKYDIEIEIGQKNCKPSTNGGVVLTNGSTFNVGCVSEADLLGQIKSACKELSANKEIAEFSETATSCKCLKRVERELKYGDYKGRVTAFTIDCKNSATNEQLKSICTEIKDKSCPTCVIESLSCECPTKKTLLYSNYSTDVEKFRHDCAGTKPNISADDVIGPREPEVYLEKDCKLYKGEFRQKEGSAEASCTCKKSSDTSPVVISVKQYADEGPKIFEKECGPKPETP